MGMRLILCTILTLLSSYIYGQPLPDLLATKISGPSSAIIGHSIAVDVEVRNDGSFAPQGWEARLYLCRHRVLSPLDIVLSAGPVPIQLARGATWAGRLPVRIQPSTPLGVYYLGVRLDATNVVQESNEGNNSLVASSTTRVIQPPTPQTPPDLCPIQIETSYSGIAGTDIPVDVIVKNQGGTSISGYELAFYLSTNDKILDGPTISSSGFLVIPSPDTYLSTVSETETLQPGAQHGDSYTVRLPILLQRFWPSPMILEPLQNGDYYIGVMVDPRALVVEADEHNNISSGHRIYVHQAPDIVPYSIGAVPVSVDVGGTVVIDSEIANGFYGNAPPGWIGGIYLNGASGPILIERYTETSWLEKGGLIRTSRTVNLPATVSPGQYTLQLRVDELDDVFELNIYGNAEGNNLHNGSQLQVQPVVDLVAVAVSGPATVIQGAHITANWEARNQGTGVDPNPWFAMLVLSVDSDITQTDSLLENSLEGSLIAGGIRSTSSEFVLDAPPGTYYLGLIVDAANYVIERDESNNCVASSTTLVVTLPPDLIVTNANGPVQAKVGASINVSADITNQGAGAAPAGWLTRWVLSVDATVDDTDVAVGDISQGGGLAPNATLTQQGTLTIPSGLVPGDYYIGARIIADFPESSITNNSTISIRAIRIR